MLLGERGKIGVFGATGFIGTRLVARLAEGPTSVVAFGRYFPSDYHEQVGSGVEFRSIDFTDVVSSQAVLHDITTVIQLINSTNPSFGNARAAEDVQSNVLPHISFIQSCIMAKVKTFVFASSGGAVYGDPICLPICEDHPTNPVSSYGLTKLIVEHYIKLLSRDSGMGYVNLRISNPYGPGQHFKRGQGLVAAILKNHFDGLPVTIFGDGSLKRDYIFIDDVVEAIVKATSLIHPKFTMNIGSEQGRSVLDVIKNIEEALDTRIDVRFSSDRISDAKDNVLDCQLGKRLLGWQPTVSFTDGISRTVPFYGR